ncbi:DUF1178 family protein [Methylocystis sp. WRRC1]|uniref:DUF1178 family protein n=1 Tax=Methylocystis sp. WRRC1 TaxID=1732014 RepID=UPI001D15BBBB|nr:DUF1178 family protein [Methylocystis sp. WRRC1]
MIHYSLICDDGHNFDSWFRDSASFESQAGSGLVSCPFCNSTKVTRGVMAPHIARGREAEAERMRALISELREKVIAGTEDVGDRFSDEARKMEDGEVERRAIRGRATFEEAKALLEEGIEILPIPGLPTEGN